MAQVSVIIPVYNIERHLARCLDSVAGQSLRDIEIICVDDGSTDGSGAILAWYAEKDSRLQVVTQPNAGPGAARNTGLALAQGEYVIFLDSDDWFEPAFLEKMLERARQTGADITICRAVEFDTNTGGDLPSDWMLKTAYLPPELVFSPYEVRDAIFQFTYGWPWDKLYKMSFLKGSGITYPPFPHSEDVVYVFQTLVSARRIAVTDVCLVHHRVKRESSVSNAARNRDPFIVWEAVKLLGKRLEEQKVYQQYEKSYLEWAMELLVWNVTNISQPQAQKKYLHMLRSQWLPEMDFDRYPASFYRDKRIYLKYTLSKCMPPQLFRAIAAIYKRGKYLFRR